MAHSLLKAENIHAVSKGFKGELVPEVVSREPLQSGFLRVPAELHRPGMGVPRIAKTGRENLYSIPPFLGPGIEQPVKH